MSEQRPTVLVVDNDDAYRAAVCIRLEEAGFNCIEAGTGAQGIEVFRMGGIDAVVTDLVMPAGDGSTLVRAVRAAGDTPVLVCTGYKDEPHGLLSEFPHLPILRKPFTPEALIEMVELELGLHGFDMSARPDTRLNDKEITMSIKVLIADDDQGLLKALTIRFEAMGFEVMSRQDAYQALAVVPTFRPDVILLDVNMPAGSGPSVEKRLSMNETHCDIPIIYMTGEDRDSVISIFADHVSTTSAKVLSKPFEAEAAGRVIREVVAQSQAAAARAS